MADSKKKKLPAIQQRKPQTYLLAMTPDETAAEARGRTLVSPAVNAASTMQSYQEFLGEDIDVMATIDAIDRSAERIKGGDLSGPRGHARLTSHCAANHLYELGPASVSAIASAAS